MTTTDIVLATCNARYSHPSLGLRFLLANLGDLAPRAVLLEYDLRKPVEAIAGEIAVCAPRIVGLGVYCWNVERMVTLARLLRKRLPEAVLVLGGPEVFADESGAWPDVPAADVLLCGEGEQAFARLCGEVLAGRKPAERILRAEPPPLDRLALPYGRYSDHDLATRLTYVETSRGCPFHCEYCLSSVRPGVRYWDLGRVLPAFDNLLARGAHRFKFVDRTFNLRADRCASILEFFLARCRPGLVLHFELVPARIDDAVAALFRRFPAGTLRFEVGVQTFDEDVARRVGRAQDNEQVARTLVFLRRETGGLVHADLIAGLPGESFGSIAAGFDRLAALAPHEIQLGILKKLRGTALGRHDAAWGMRYRDTPPYDLLESRTLSAADLARLSRFARCWELLVNRGKFTSAAPMIWAGQASVYHAFDEAAGFLHARFGRLHALPLDVLAEGLFDFLTRVRGPSADRVAAALLGDPFGQTRTLSRRPAFLRGY